jgi:hypothetical protein
MQHLFKNLKVDLKIVILSIFCIILCYLKLVKDAILGPNGFLYYVCTWEKFGGCVETSMTTK